jgi:glutathione S-transferase
MAKLRLLGRLTSINVRKVTWTLDELGVPYDREDWGQPLRDPRDPEFLKFNPNAQVPVLIDDGFVLWESNAIIRYLAKKYPSDLLPRDLQGQALVDQWLSWQLGELNPQWGYAVQALMRRNASYTDETRIADSVAKWTAKMDVLEGQLARTRAYVTGETFTIADIALALSVHRWFMTPLKHKGLPEVARYYERTKERKAGRAWMGKETP